MTRPIKAHVDLTALQHNFNLAKAKNHGPTVAVIKANAYGHGAVACARALASSADGFAVASLEEARNLREAGIQIPILLLEGFFEATELSEINALNCWIVIHAEWQIEVLSQYAPKNKWVIWLKVDSGMHRLGLSPEAVEQVYPRLLALDTVQSITLMTHFANADSLNSDDVTMQMSVFQSLIQQIGFEGDVSVSNSAATLGWSDIADAFSSTHWARPGLILYGSDPFYGQTQSQQSSLLNPVMTLSARLIEVKTILAGESIGYGSLFTAHEDTRIGVVACGYADGYPRTAQNAPAMIAGRLTRIIGRVSMDMLFVDLQGIPEAKIGSDVELWGKNVSVDAVAKSANTLAYELLCNVKRVQLTYS